MTEKTEEKFPYWREFFLISNEIRNCVEHASNRQFDRMPLAQSRTIEVVTLSMPRGVSLSELAKARGVTAGTASVAVDALVDAGFLVRRAIPEDRRKVRILLTEKANERMQNLNAVAHERFEDSIKDFSESELEAFRKILTKLRENLSAPARKG